MYEFDFYLGKKVKTELRLRNTVVLDLSKKLKNALCMLYFDNIFNFLTLLEKLFDRVIYCLGTVRNDRQNIAIMKQDKDMKRYDINFQYANNVVAVKWFDNRGATMVCTCLEKCNKVSTGTRRVKLQRTKILVLCPKIIKFHNSFLGGVDLLNQKTAWSHWTACHLMSVITLDYFLIWWISLLEIRMQFTKYCTLREWNY